MLYYDLLKSLFLSFSFITNIYSQIKESYNINKSYYLPKINLNNNTIIVTVYNNCFNFKNLDLKLNIFRHLNLYKHDIYIPINLNTSYEINKNLSLVLNKGILNKFTNLIFNYKRLDKKFIIQMGYTLSEGIYLGIIKDAYDDNTDNFIEQLKSRINSINERDLYEDILEKNFNLVNTKKNLIEIANSSLSNEESEINETTDNKNDLLSDSNILTNIDAENISNNVDLYKTHINIKTNNQRDIGTYQQKVFYYSKIEKYIKQAIINNIEYEVFEMYYILKSLGPSLEQTIVNYPQTINCFFRTLQTKIVKGNLIDELMLITKEYLEKTQLRIDEKHYKLSNPQINSLSKDHSEFIYKLFTETQEHIQKTFWELHGIIEQKFAELRYFIRDFAINLLENIENKFLEIQIPLQISLNAIFRKKIHLKLIENLDNLGNSQNIDYIEYKHRNIFLNEMQPFLINFCFSFRKNLQLIFNLTYNNLYKFNIILRDIKLYYGEVYSNRLINKKKYLKLREDKSLRESSKFLLVLIKDLIYKGDIYTTNNIHQRYKKVLLRELIELTNRIILDLVNEFNFNLFKFPENFRRPIRKLILTDVLFIHKKFYTKFLENLDLNRSLSLLT